jgi:hypothetical protein
MINIKEIKKEHPKAYELLRQFIENGLKEMQNRMAQNVGSVKIEDIPPVDEKIVEGVLYWNQRQLLDFFDLHNQEISVGFTGTPTEKLYDSYVNDLFVKEDDTRLEVEEAAYKVAFESLEKIS